MSKIKKCKRCSKCKKLKLLSEFYRCNYRFTKEGLQGWCKECGRKSDLKCKFGVTPEQHNKLFKKQKGCCAICKRLQSDSKRKFAVDHDHQTGNVRGLLCLSCNVKFSWYQNNKMSITQYEKKYNK